MFDVLSDGFKKASLFLRSKAELTEENLAEAMQTVRQSLLEADVDYVVVKHFVAKVKDSLLGQQVHLKAGHGTERLRVKPSDHFIKTCEEQLVALMGPVDVTLKYPVNRPSIMMMIGLQGTGKTTTTAKLAQFLIRTRKKKPLLVAADVYRAAAVQQLQVLGEKLGVPVFSKPNATPVEICKDAVQYAFLHDCDVVLLDTAGRLTIDDALMAELSEIKASIRPDNTLLVCDAMMGQDAVTTAQAFHEKLQLDGFILTKLDGDARGGAALSIKQVIGRPIKFLGMGEGLDALEEFRPEGLASRILGMGDVIGLMEDFERIASDDMLMESTKMLSGHFDLNDFYTHITMIQRMGPLKDLVAKLPFQNAIPKNIILEDDQLFTIKTIINSMTKQERLRPELFDNSRIKRVAKGSGRSIKEVAELLNKFKTIRHMMGQLGKANGILNNIPGLQHLGQFNQMRKAMQGGDNPFASLMQGMPGAATSTGGFKRVDRDKIKKARKEAQKHRKQQRKK